MTPISSEPMTAFAKMRFRRHLHALRAYEGALRAQEDALQAMQFVRAGIAAEEVTSDPGVFTPRRTH